MSKYNTELRILKQDKTDICDNCGKKIEPKVARFVLSPNIHPRTYKICWSCGVDILTKNFYGGDK